jgi:hypothetical protein
MSVNFCRLSEVQPNYELAQRQIFEELAVRNISQGTFDPIETLKIGKR